MKDGQTPQSMCQSHVFYKKHNESNENDNDSNNRYDVFAEDMELENAKYEEESAKIIT